VIDLIVIPRKPSPVCELVSPLKPLEAAAHRKAILLSDVDPLADFASTTNAAAVFKKGDICNLSENIKSCLSNEDWSEHCGRTGREWAEKNTWFFQTRSISAAI